MRETANYKMRDVLLGHVGAVGSLAYDRVGGRLASGSQDGSVRTWAEERPLPTIRRPGARIHSLQFSPDGALLAAMAGDGKLWVFRGGS